MFYIKVIHCALPNRVNLQQLNAKNLKENIMENNIDQWFEDGEKSYVN